MKKNKTNTEAVNAKVTTLFVRPTFLATAECPHCWHLNFCEVWEDQKKKTLLHNCDACNKDFALVIPEFKS